MVENQDVNTLKRRGRRRLIGAIALVLAAVIVLPMVFDSEPRGSAPPVSVRIPGENETGFTPKVTPKPPSAQEQKAPAKLAEKAAEKTSDAQLEKTAPKVEIAVTTGSGKPAAKGDAEQKRAEAALAGPLSGEQFVVPAGAYAVPDGVIETLKAANIPYYTEPIATKQGTVIRVRAGPFASRDAAEQVFQKLKGLGLKPGNIASKS